MENIWTMNARAKKSFLHQGRDRNVFCKVSYSRPCVENKSKFGVPDWLSWCFIIQTIQFGYRKIHSDDVDMKHK